MGSHVSWILIEYVYIYIYRDVCVCLRKNDVEWNAYDMKSIHLYICIHAYLYSIHACIIFIRYIIHIWSILRQYVRCIYYIFVYPAFVTTWSGIGKIMLLVRDLGFWFIACSWSAICEIYDQQSCGKMCLYITNDVGRWLWVTIEPTIIGNLMCIYIYI